MKSILLPFGENVHTGLALELAPALVEHFQARLVVALVVPPGIDSAERERRCLKATKIRCEEDCRRGTRTLEEEDVVRGIVDASRSTDLLLMGGRTGSFWEMLAASSLTEDITRQANCPVVWAEEYEESKPLIARLLSRSDEERSVGSHEG